MKVPCGQIFVMIDRTVAVQSFRYEGSLTNAELSHYLERYSGERAISTTETANSIRESSFEAPPKEGAVKQGVAGAGAGGGSMAGHAGHGGYVVAGGYAGGCGGGACY